MSNTVIRVENLSKKYLLNHQQANASQYKALRDILALSAKSIAQRLNPLHKEKSSNPIREEFWALKDVSFEIKQGDRVGIIGRNGAGKSTLLKILSRITEPTTGRISIKGRIASLLEVGTGFHPELTGRENIFLNGAILGMGRIEIKKKFDEIVAFAEVEKFLDTPVKRYSSGMYVRLAFAVAAHLEPEVLVVDEVLAVGDSSFQKKCLGKMKDVATSGRTIIFVSHNMNAIESLCDRGILLHKGSISYCGNPREAITQYTIENSTSSSGYVDLSNKFLDHHGPKNLSCLKSLSLLNIENNTVDTLSMGETAYFRMQIEFKSEGENFEIGIAICNLYGVRLHYLISNWEEQLIIYEEGVYEIEVMLPRIYLFPGDYVVNIWTKHQGGSYDAAVHEALRFSIKPANITPQYAYFERYSTNTQVYTPSKWKILKKV
ncbi:ABC transporter ATP-binding protein [Acaryochloris marina NIES-2412]|uniref:ABC transporter ATP-binding protein n=1 Tax=Acaryochloris marina TaxID=155978 RepID=UPI0040594073